MDCWHHLNCTQQTNNTCIRQQVRLLSIHRNPDWFNGHEGTDSPSCKSLCLSIVNDHPYFNLFTNQSIYRKVFLNGLHYNSTPLCLLTVNLPRTRKVDRQSDDEAAQQSLIIRLLHQYSIQLDHINTKSDLQKQTTLRWAWISYQNLLGTSKQLVQSPWKQGQ